MAATSVPIINPAGYVTQHAIAVSDGSGAASAVHAGNPLPVTLTPREAPTPSPLIGETSESGVFGPFAPLPGRPIWLTLAGSWSGVVTVQRSPDGNGERNALTVAGKPWARFTGNVQEPVAEESVATATWHLEVALTSGTLAYEVRQ